jgi:hypothetical protein
MSHTIAPLPKNLDSVKINQQIKALNNFLKNLTCPYQTHNRGLFTDFTKDFDIVNHDKWNLYGIQGKLDSGLNHTNSVTSGK